MTRRWNETGTPASAQDLDAIAGQALRSISDRPNIDLFWRVRLLGALRFVNKLEAERRTESIVVTPEREVLSELTLLNDSVIELYGRMDRVEMRANAATIIDHKTGDIPSEKQIRDGRATQLLTYAILLEQESYKTEALEYWQLPRLGDEGEILRVAMDAALAETGRRVLAALATMREELTPFLARPLKTSADERFGNPYDGISRYDEWAG